MHGQGELSLVRQGNQRLSTVTEVRTTTIRHTIFVRQELLFYAQLESDERLLDLLHQSSQQFSTIIPQHIDPRHLAPACVLLHAWLQYTRFWTRDPSPPPMILSQGE